MGGTTIRRQTNHEDLSASVQRFVIQQSTVTLPNFKDIVVGSRALGCIRCTADSQIICRLLPRPQCQEATGEVRQFQHLKLPQV